MTPDPSKDRIETRTIQLTRMERFIGWVLRIPPPKPYRVRITHCTLCGEEIETAYMSDAPMIHRFCRMAEETAQKVLKKREQADRKRIDLIKTAMRELKQEESL